MANEKVKKFKDKHNKPPKPQPGELVDPNETEYWYNEQTDTGIIRVWEAHDEVQGMSALDARIARCEVELARLVKIKEKLTGE
jgi:hypothetical protein